jgi:hypothetical protein
MRKVEEIKADIEAFETNPYNKDGTFDVERGATLQAEARAALTADIPLDRLSALCAAECLALREEVKRLARAENARLNGYYINHATCHECPCKLNFDARTAERDQLAADLDRAIKALVDLGHCTRYPGFTCDADFPAACPECIREWLHDATCRKNEDDNCDEDCEVEE